MDVEKTIEFLLGQQARFDAQMAALTDKMESMADYQIGMDERHDREIFDIRSTLRQAVRLSVEEQRRERVRRQVLDTKVDKMATSLQEKVDKIATSVQELIDAMKKDRNGH